VDQVRRADTASTGCLDQKTAVDSIFSTSSKIVYSCDHHEYVFTFDPKLKSLNCKAVVAQQLRDSLEVELPMPYGNRFNFFQSISNADHEIRRNIVLENYSRPDELIDLFGAIYNSSKFDNLRCITIKKKLTIASFLTRVDTSGKTISVLASIF